MASYLIDKLEALKTNELEIKEQQRILEEEIAFEMEKQRRLEMEGTITKLRTQIGEFAKNIEGLIMPNNIEAVMHFCRPEKEMNKYEIQQKRKAMSKISRGKITLNEFKNNLNKIGKGNTELLKSGLPFPGEDTLGGKGYPNQLAQINLPVKIYDDIIPLFITIMGIMKKQGEEIKKLKSNI